MTHLEPLLKGRRRNFELTTGVGGRKSKKPTTGAPNQVHSENQDEMDASRASEEDSDVSDDQNELETMNLATGENDYLFTAVVFTGYTGVPLLAS